MKVEIFKTSSEASKKALELFKLALSEGDKVFGLATGSTPEELYALMSESADIDFSEATSINLDEYYGLDQSHPQSYHAYMKHHLFNQKPFKASYLPDGSNEDAEAEVKRYDELLKENPIDLQLLGLGSNGHIGFNEPGSSFDSTTRLVALADSTIQANKRFFDSEEDVPKQAYSMGMQSIMAADKIILMAFGEGKAWAVNEMINGEISPDVPATILQNHDNVTILIDEAAASKLNN